MRKYDTTRNNIDYSLASQQYFNLCDKVKKIVFYLKKIITKSLFIYIEVYTV